MSVLLDKLRNAAKSRARDATPDHLAEGSLLSQALHRAESERAAARAAQDLVRAAEAATPPPIDQETAHAPVPAPAPSPAPAGAPRASRGFAALLLALAILAAVIALWHAAPSPYDAHQDPPSSLKLDHNLKTK